MPEDKKSKKYIQVDNVETNGGGSLNNFLFGDKKNGKYINVEQSPDFNLKGYYGFNNFAEYANQGILNFSTDPRQYQNIKANMQSGPELVGKIVLGVVPNFVAGFLDSMAMNDVKGIYDMSVGNTEKEFTNWLHELSKSIRELSPTVYQHTDSSPWSAEHWASLAQQGFHSLGIVGEMIAEQLLLSSILPGAGNLASLSKLKNLRLTTTAGLGMFKGVGEAYLNGLETLEDTYQTLKEKGYSDEEAKRLAAETASEAYRREVLPLALLNGLQFVSYFGRPISAFENIEGIETGFSGAFEGLFGGLAKNKIYGKIVTGLSESFEEGVQTYISQYSQEKKLKELGKNNVNKPFTPFNQEMYDSLILGGLFGLGMSVGAEILEKRNPIDKKLKKQYELFANEAPQRIRNVLSEYANAHKELVDSYKEVQKELNASNLERFEKAKARINELNGINLVGNVVNALQYDYINKDTKGYDSLIAGMENIKKAIEDNDIEQLKSIGLVDKNGKEVVKGILNRVKNELNENIQHSEKIKTMLENNLINVTSDFNTAYEITKEQFLSYYKANEISKVDEKINEHYNKAYQEGLDSKIIEYAKLKNQELALKEFKDNNKLNEVQNKIKEIEKDLSEEDKAKAFPYINRNIILAERYKELLKKQVKEHNNKVKEYYDSKNVKALYKKALFNRLQKIKDLEDLNELENEAKEKNAFDDVLKGLINDKREELLKEKEESNNNNIKVEDKKEEIKEGVLSEIDEPEENTKEENIENDTNEGEFEDTEDSIEKLIGKESGISKKANKLLKGKKVKGTKKVKPSKLEVRSFKHFLTNVLRIPVGRNIDTFFNDNFGLILQHYEVFYEILSEKYGKQLTFEEVLQFLASKYKKAQLKSFYNKLRLLHKNLYTYRTEEQIEKFFTENFKDSKVIINTNGTITTYTIGTDDSNYYELGSIFELNRVFPIRNLHKLIELSDKKVHLREVEFKDGLPDSALIFIDDEPYIIPLNKTYYFEERPIPNFNIQQEEIKEDTNNVENVENEEQIKENKVGVQLEIPFNWEELSTEKAEEIIDKEPQIVKEENEQIQSIKEQEEVNKVKQENLNKEDKKAKLNEKRINKYFKKIEEICGKCTTNDIKGLSEEQAIEVLNNLYQLKQKYLHLLSDSQKMKMTRIYDTIKTFKGLEIVDLVGELYDDRMKLTTNFIEHENTGKGSVHVIKRVRRPQINKDGKMIQSAEVDVVSDIPADSILEIAENEPVPYIKERLNKAYEKAKRIEEKRKEKISENKVEEQNKTENKKEDKNVEEAFEEANTTFLDANQLNKIFNKQKENKEENRTDIEKINTPMSKPKVALFIPFNEDDKYDITNNDDKVNPTFILDYEKYKPGTKIRVIIPENASEIPIRVNGEKTTYGKYAKEANPDELYKKVPLALVNEKGTIIGFIHDVEWYDYSNHLNNLSDEEIQAAKIRTERLRKQLYEKINNNETAEVVISSREIGSVRKSDLSNPREYPKTVNLVSHKPRFIIASDKRSIKEVNPKLYSKTKNLNVNINWELGEKELVPGGVYELREIGIDANGEPIYIISELKYKTKESKQTYVDNFKYAVLSSILLHTDSKKVEQVIKDKFNLTRESAEKIRQAILDEYGVDIKTDLHIYTQNYIANAPMWMFKGVDKQYGLNFVRVTSNAINILNNPGHPNEKKAFVNFYNINENGLLHFLNTFEETVQKLSPNWAYFQVDPNKKHLKLTNAGAIKTEKSLLDFYAETTLTDILGYRFYNEDGQFRTTVNQYPVINIAIADSNIDVEDNKVKVKEETIKTDDKQEKIKRAKERLEKLKRRKKGILQKTFEEEITSRVNKMELKLEGSSLRFIKTSEETVKQISKILSKRLGIKVEFYKDENSNIKGYLENGKAYINLAKATLDTPYHEIFAHPIIRFLKTIKELDTFEKWLKFSDRLPYKYRELLADFTPMTVEEFKKEHSYTYKREEENYKKFKEKYSEVLKLYDNLIEELSYSNEGKLIINKIRKEYQELSEDEVLEEALVTILGMKSAEIKNSRLKRFIEKIKRFFNRIFNKLAFDGEINILELKADTTIEDLAKLASNDEIIINFNGVFKNRRAIYKHFTGEEFDNYLSLIEYNNIIKEEINKLVREGVVEREDIRLEHLRNHILSRLISKEVIEDTKRKYNIKYNPRIIYDKGDKIIHKVGAFSIAAKEEILLNFVKYFKTSLKTGEDYILSSTIEYNNNRRHDLTLTDDDVWIEIVANSDDIKWVTYEDSYSGTISQIKDILKDEIRQVKVTPIANTKYPVDVNLFTTSLNNLYEIEQDEYPELGVRITRGNFIIKYGKNVPDNLKELIDKINEEFKLTRKYEDIKDVEEFSGNEQEVLKELKEKYTKKADAYFENAEKVIKTLYKFFEKVEDSYSTFADFLLKDNKYDFIIVHDNTYLIEKLFDNKQLQKELELTEEKLEELKKLSSEGISPLTPIEQDELVTSLIHEILSLVDIFGDVSKQINEFVKEYPKEFLDSHIEQTEEEIKELKSLNDASINEDIELLEEQVRKLKEVREGYLNKLEKVIKTRLIRFFQEDIFEGEEEALANNLEQEKNYSKSFVEGTLSKQLGLRLKVLFSSIPKFDSNGNVVENSLGIIEYEDFEYVVNYLSTKLVEAEPTREGVLKVLSKYANTGNIIAKNILEILQKDERLLNEVIFKLVRDENNMLQVKIREEFDVIEGQKFSSGFKINFVPANRSTIIRKKVDKVYKEFTTTPYYNRKGEYNIEELRSTFEKFKTLDINSAKEIILSFGIDVSDAAIQMDYNKYISKKRRQSLLYMLENGIKKVLNGEDLNILNEVKNGIYSIVRYDVEINGTEVIPSFYIGGKSILGTVNRTLVGDITRELKSENSELRKALLESPLSKNNYLLQALEELEEVRDNLKYGFIATVPISFINGDNESVTKFQQSARADRLLVEFAAFQTTQALTGKAIPNSTLQTRMAYMFLPTQSDKSNSAMWNTLLVDLQGNDIISDVKYGYSLHDRVADLLVKEYYESEFDRIVFSYKNNTKYKGLNKYGKKFLLMPTLNSIKDSNGISIFELIKSNLDNEEALNTIKSKLSEKAKEIILDKINSEIVELTKELLDAKLITKEESTGNTIFRYFKDEYVNYKEKSVGDKTIRNNNRKLTYLMVADFVVNQYLSNATAFKTIIFDPAFYGKGNENNFSIKTGENITKRMASLIAPKNKMADSDSEHIQIYMKDSEIMSSLIEQYIETYYDEIDEEGRKMLNSLIKLDKQIKEEKDEIKLNNLKNTRDKIVEELSNKYPEVSDYFNIEATDAQEFTTWREHLRILYNKGDLTKEQKEKIEKAYEKLSKGEEIEDKEVLKLIMQPIKPITTGWYIDKTTDTPIIVPIYIKSSSFPLLPQMTRDFKLDNLRKVMEKLEEEEGKTVRLNFLTADKATGYLSNFEMSDLEKYNEEELVQKAKDNSLIIKRTFLGIQQNTPFKTLKGKTPEGTQMWKIITGDGINRIKEEVFPNKFDKKLLERLGIEDKEFLTGEEIDRIKTAIDFEYIQQKQDKLLKQLSADDKQELFVNIVNMLREEAVKRGYPDAIIKQLDLLEKKDNLSDLMVSLLRNEELLTTMIPILASSNFKKFDSLIQSIVNNRVLKSKVPGFAGILGTSVGFEVKSIDEIDKNILSQVVWVDKQFDKLKPMRFENDKVVPADVLISPKWTYTDENGNKVIVDLTDDKYSYVENGVRYLKLDMIDEELLNMFSFRIPTSSLQSGALLRVVGFLPQGVGELMVTAPEYLVQIGEDFDIDKRYVYLDEYYFDKNGEIKRKNSLVNDKFAIYKSVYSTTSKEIQRKIKRKLTTKPLEDTIKFINKLKNKVNKIENTFTSNRFQENQLDLAADGNFGIGVWSNAITLYALLTRTNTPIKLLRTVTKDGKNYTENSRIKIGRNVSEGVINNLKDFAGNDISDNLSMNQNSSLDNMKLLIMAHRNENPYTINVLINLVLRGFGLEEVNYKGEKVKVDMPSLFLSQGVIKEYVDIVKNLTSSIVGLSKWQAHEEAMNILFSRYIKEDTLKGEEHREISTEELVNNLSQPNEKTNAKIIKLFAELYEESQVFGDFSNLYNVSNGYGNSIVDLYEKFEKVLDFDSIFKNAPQLKDTLFKEVKVEDEKDIPEDALYVEDKKIALVPTSSEGKLLLTGLETGLLLNQSVMKLDSSTIKNLNKVSKELNLKTSLSRVFNSSRFYITSKSLFDDVIELRNKLLTADKSLASYLHELRRKGHPVMNNQLMKEISFDFSTSSKYDYFFLEKAGKGFKELNMYKNILLEMFEMKDKELPDWNGEKMNYSKLAAYIVVYNTLLNTDTATKNFDLIIDPALLRVLGIAQAFEKNIDSLKDELGAYKMLVQYAINNPFAVYKTARRKNTIKYIDRDSIIYNTDEKLEPLLNLNGIIFLLVDESKKLYKRVYYNSMDRETFLNPYVNIGGNNIIEVNNNALRIFNNINEIKVTKKQKEVEKQAAKKNKTNVESLDDFLKDMLNKNKLSIEELNFIKEILDATKIKVIKTGFQIGNRFFSYKDEDTALKHLIIYSIIDSQSFEDNNALKSIIYQLSSELNKKFIENGKVNVNLFLKHFIYNTNFYSKVKERKVNRIPIKEFIENEILKKAKETFSENVHSLFDKINNDKKEITRKESKTEIDSNAIQDLFKKGILKSEPSYEENFITRKNNFEEVSRYSNDKTKSPNVIIKPISELNKIANEQSKTGKRDYIIALRENNSTNPEVLLKVFKEKNKIGNPFKTKEYGEGKATEMFFEWLTTDKYDKQFKNLKEYKQALLKAFKSSELKDKPILYYKELNRPSHATVIDYLSNNYFSNKENLNTSDFTLHSGGAIGSDTVWGEIGKKYGLKSINHYYFENNKTPNGNKPLPLNIRKEADEKLIEANKKLGRKFPTRNEYVNNLLRRNWWQVKNSDAIFAIGKINRKDFNTVEGGTGWAVQMAINENKPVYMFDQELNNWYVYDKTKDKFVKTDTPVLTPNFAGIGTRKLNGKGRKAIEDVYKNTFKKANNIKTTSEESVIKENIEKGQYVKYKGKSYIVLNKVGKNLQIYNPNEEGANKKVVVKPENVVPLNYKSKIVEYRGRKYIVTPKNSIISLSTGKLLNWDENNGNRKAILELVNKKKNRNIFEEVKKEQKELKEGNTILASTVLNENKDNIDELIKEFEKGNTIVFKWLEEGTEVNKFAFKVIQMFKDDATRSIETEVEGPYIKYKLKNVC